MAGVHKSNPYLTDYQLKTLDRMRDALDRAFIGKATPDDWRALFEGLGRLEGQLTNVERRVKELESTVR